MGRQMRMVWRSPTEKCPRHMGDADLLAARPSSRDGRPARRTVRRIAGRRALVNRRDRKKSANPQGRLIRTRTPRCLDCDILSRRSSGVRKSALAASATRRCSIWNPVISTWSIRSDNALRRY